MQKEIHVPIDVPELRSRIAAAITRAQLEITPALVPKIVDALSFNRPTFYYGKDIYGRCFFVGISKRDTVIAAIEHGPDDEAYLDAIGQVFKSERLSDLPKPKAKKVIASKKIRCYHAPLIIEELGIHDGSNIYFEGRYHPEAERQRS